MAAPSTNLQGIWGEDLFPNKMKHSSKIICDVHVYIYNGYLLNLDQSRYYIKQFNSYVRQE